jgi:hypothetical protein
MSAAPAAARVECPVSFFVEELLNPVALSSIEFGVLYSPPSLVFSGKGLDVECSNQAPTATAVFDDDDRGRLDVAFESETAIPTIFNLLAVCRTRSNDIPTEADLEVVDLVEEDTSGQPASIPVQILLPTAEDCTVLPTTTSSTSTSSISTTSTTSTTLDEPSCGDPNGDGSVTATDSLFVLNAAVGLTMSELCICDVNGDGVVSATDSLLLLNVAVGQPLPLQCPAC